MSTFPLCPPHIPPMIGRVRLFKRMVDELTKPTPQSLSLVGPRFFGKSVVLSALAQDPRITNSYCCVVQWDLGHQIPQSDEEFITAMRHKLSAALIGKNDDIAKHLTKETAGYDELLESFELLETEKQRILMLWDGLDPTIGSGKLTRNLWDNLLALGKKDSLALVTSSRRKLHELARDAQSVSSEFWLLFDVVKLDVMNEEDVTAFSEQMTANTFHTGTVKEILNWTGGIPALVVWILNRISEGNPEGAITNGSVNDAGRDPDDKCSGILDYLWSDCSAPAADLYRHILETGQLDYGGLPKQERVALIDVGLIVQHNGKAGSACRLMETHIGGTNPEFGALARMFGSWDSYKANIRGILERRIAQIPRFDETLTHMVQRAIEDLPEHPDTSLSNLSHIEDHALDLIWTGELGGARCLGSDVITYWTESPRDRHNLVRPMMEADHWEIPGDRASQLRVLQLLTGSHQDFGRSIAKCATKDTYVLLSAIHTFRNRHQHSGGQSIELGVAVSALMLCVELLACLAKSHVVTSQS
jgi:hypothetical protein